MTLIIAALLAPFAVLTIYFAVEIFAGLKPLPEVNFTRSEHASVVIIVPAHDEELGIKGSLERLTAAASSKARVLLVADNCTDRTAEIGRGFGVEVIERFNVDQRGKGFALDFARQHLESAPPDVVVIVDADCTIDGNSIEYLASSCAALQRPCQATNLLHPNPSASPAVQLSTFAFFIKNVIRQRALTRLTGRAHLFGTGMALPWSIFAQGRLATSNIVEDLKLGLELANAGQSAVFIERAAVWSRAETDANAIAQRQRWEGGFLQNAIRAGPQMVQKAVVRKDLRLLWAALDILIPPFALLILLDLIVLSLARTVSWLVRAPLWPLYGLCGALALAFASLAFAWANGGHRFVSLRSLARAPLYVARKLPMYIGFVRRGVPKQWHRTNRT